MPLNSAMFWNVRATPEAAQVGGHPAPGMPFQRIAPACGR